MFSKVKKNACICFSCILIICLCSVSVFADDNGNDSDQNDQSSVPTEYVETQASATVLRISASDTNGLHSIVLSLIGDYNPVVKDYTYTTTSYNGSVTTNHSIDIQPDWSWIASAFIFCIVLYSFFRILGSLFGGGRK